MLIQLDPVNGISIIKKEDLKNRNYMQHSEDIMYKFIYAYLKKGVPIYDINISDVSKRTYNKIKKICKINKKPNNNFVIIRTNF